MEDVIIKAEAFAWGAFGLTLPEAINDELGCYIRTEDKGDVWMSPRNCIQAFINAVSDDPLSLDEVLEYLLI